MNSTDDAALRELLGALFDDLAAPRAGAAAPFPMAPGAAQASYYTERARPAMAPGDFSAPSCLDGAELAARLAAHWRALGRDQLAEAAPRIAQLACTAQTVVAARARQAEVSPYIYAMF